MKKHKSLYFTLISILAIIFLAFSRDDKKPEREAKAGASRIISRTENFENFEKMMAVLTHQRCVNCHPKDNIPKQGEDSHPHYFGMSRGEANTGFEATNCNTCHQNENNDFSGVPGAPEWSLAPESMKWEGLSPTEIAESILDKKRNGGRNHHEVMEHLTEHALVLWAWTPGIDAAGNQRETPPVPKEEYIRAVREWFEAGAIIPEK